MFLYDFLSIFRKPGSKSLEIDHIIKSITCLIFNVYVFYHVICSRILHLAELHSIKHCLKNRTFLSNCFFIMICVFVINKISTASNADCKDY